MKNKTETEKIMKEGQIKLTIPWTQIRLIIS